MSGRENFPTGPEQEPISGPVLKRYNDGNLAIEIKTPGYTVVFGPDSAFEDARNLSGDSMVIVNTQGKNEYHLVRGRVRNVMKKTVEELPEELPSWSLEVTIEEPVTFPGGSRSTPAKRVLIHCNVHEAGMPEEWVDTPSPFVAIQKNMDRVIDEYPLAEY